MQNLIEKIEVIEFNNRDYWIQPIQRYPAVQWANMWLQWVAQGSDFAKICQLGVERS